MENPNKETAILVDSTSEHNNDKYNTLNRDV